jgi:hypothetical protein
MVKIRIGFVSNSSSSSFAIFGIETDWEELTKVFFPDFKKTPKQKVSNCAHSFDREIMAFCPTCGAKAWKVIEAVKTVDQYEVRKKIGEIDWSIYTETDYGTIVGLELGGEGKTSLKELQEFNEEVVSKFGREASFLSGEYAC